MMNNTVNDNDDNNYSCLDIQPYTPPPISTARDHSFSPFKVAQSSSSLVIGGCSTSTTLPLFKNPHQPNPRKKRTKLIRLDRNTNTYTSSSSGGVAKPKYAKKPVDPGAPKITRPCSECGKKFWSWKALFGHMRCHPERQWRGINPPPNLRMTDEDREVASCLLMLANGPAAATDHESPSVSQVMLEFMSADMEDTVLGFGSSSNNNSRFQCSSCKKVFGSRQALGGHRASHKNVKGCFAITRNNVDGDGEEERMEVLAKEEEDDEYDEDTHNHNKMVMVVGGHHQCSICLRVFSSGQALGGHKRCHWEKVDEPADDHDHHHHHRHHDHHIQLTNFFSTIEGGSSGGGSGGGGSGGGRGGLDLNLPAPLLVQPPAPAVPAIVHDDDDDDDDDTRSSYSSTGMELDLRLGL